MTSLIAAVIGVVALAVVSWYGSTRLRSVLWLYCFVSLMLPTAFGYAVLGENGVVISPARMVAVVGVLSFAIAAVGQPVARRHFPIAGVLAWYLGVRIAELVVSTDFLGGLIFLFGEAGLTTAIFSYIAFCTVRTDRHLSQLVSALLVAGVLISMIGWWEWINQLNFNANVIMPLVGVTQATPQSIYLKATQFPRITATLDHSLALAGLMTLLIPMAAQRMSFSRGASFSLNLVLVAILGLSLFLTFSRIAQLATVLELVACVYLFRARVAGWALVSMMSIGILQLVRIYANTPETLDENTSLLIPTYTIGLIAERWIELASLLVANPIAALIGFGNNRFATANVSEAAQIAQMYTVIDTELIRVLGMTGLIGFTAWILMFVVFFRRVASAVRAVGSAIWQSPVIAIAVGIGGALVTAIPGQSVFSYTQTWPVIGILMGGSLGALSGIRASAPVAVPSRTSADGAWLRPGCLAATNHRPT